MRRERPTDANVLPGSCQKNKRAAYRARLLHALPHRPTVPPHHITTTRPSTRTNGRYERALQANRIAAKVILLLYRHPRGGKGCFHRQATKTPENERWRQHAGDVRIRKNVRLANAAFPCEH